MVSVCERIVNEVQGRKLKRMSRQVVEEFGLQNWFAKKIPYERPYASWVLNRLSCLPRDTVIVETGCGIGQNLYLINRLGFYNLVGIEKDRNTAQAARSLLKKVNADITIHEDSGENILRYVQPGRVGVVLNLNWVYFFKPIEELFRQSSLALAPSGFVYIDVIVPHFQANGAKESRAYDYYPHKYDVADAVAKARTHGLTLVCIYPQNPQYTLSFSKSVQ